MMRQPEPEPPIASLQVVLDRGESGCLEVHQPGRGSARVFVAEGQIRGAETPVDSESVLRRLQARGYLTEDMDADLVQALLGGAGTEQLAGRVPGAEVRDVIDGCFRQVLLDFLFAPAPHRFEAGDQIRPTHLQVGHDSSALVAGLAEVHGRIAGWRESQGARVLRQSGTPPAVPEARSVWEQCAAGPSVAELVARSPWFEGRTLMQVAELVSSGALVAAAEDLDAFVDHASEDRGLGQGHFTSSHLDRVDTGMRQPTLRTGESRLDDAELSRKISVVSDVLRVMVRAMDKAGQDGQAQLQLVMDAAPLHLRSLFEGVQLERDGRLDEAAITHNLRSRVPTEQRLLLQRGLTDLLDRALSRCMDSLPSVPADQLLGRVVGYQKRLGR